MIKDGLLTVLIVLCNLVAAETITISGSVIGPGNKPLKDVALSLTGTPTISTTSDSAGNFTLTNSTHSKVSPVVRSKPFEIDLKGKTLILYNASAPLHGTITIFSGNGKQLAYIELANPGLKVRRFTLPTLASGLNMIRVELNSKTYSYHVINIGNALYFKKSNPINNTSGYLSKSLAAVTVDTITCKKDTYTTKKTPITSYQLANLTISLDTAIAKKECNATTLKEAGMCSREILIGNAIMSREINNPVLKEFNYITAENEMKWQTLQGSEGKFNYSGADKIVNWAKSNGVKVKGHCLVWHSQLAGWVSGAKGRERVLGIMKKHIETVMGHFGNNVYAWDVVNEAIATDDDIGKGNARMRNSVFYNEIGPDYIEQAFKIAREYADSHNMKDMKLYYNDYSIDADNDKSRFARTMIKELVDKKTPIDGVGFQMHIGPPNNIPTVEAVRDNMQYYADLGLEVLISEFDINLCGNKVTREQQLKFYHDITEVCVNQPKCVAITWWGINDEESWLNSFGRALCNGGNSQSLLFSNNKKKDTYQQVLNALNGK